MEFDRQFVWVISHRPVSSPAGASQPVAVVTSHTEAMMRAFGILYEEFLQTGGVHTIDRVDLYGNEEASRIVFTLEAGTGEEAAEAEEEDDETGYIEAGQSFSACLITRHVLLTESSGKGEASDV